MKATRMITRTVSVTNVVAMCVNTETATVTNNTYMLLSVPEKADLLKLVKKYETETVKVVSIVSSVSQDLIFGMPEDKFVALADVVER